MLSGRWPLARLEDLAGDPVASNEVRAQAVNMPRRSVDVGPIVLPVDMETVALQVADNDGKVMTIEALLPGSVIAFRW